MMSDEYSWKKRIFGVTSGPRYCQLRCHRYPFLKTKSGTNCANATTIKTFYLQSLPVFLTMAREGLELSEKQSANVGGIFCTICQGTRPSWKWLRFWPSHRNPRCAQTDHLQKWKCGPSASDDETTVEKISIAVRGPKSLSQRLHHSPNSPANDPYDIPASCHWYNRWNHATKISHKFSDPVLGKFARAVDWHQKEIRLFWVQCSAGGAQKVAMK